MVTNIGSLLFVIQLFVFAVVDSAAVNSTESPLRVADRKDPSEHAQLLTSRRDDHSGGEAHDEETPAQKIDADGYLKNDTSRADQHLDVNDTDTSSSEEETVGAQDRMAPDDTETTIELDNRTTTDTRSTAKELWNALKRVADIDERISTDTKGGKSINEPKSADDMIHVLMEALSGDEGEYVTEGETQDETDDNSEYDHADWMVMEKDDNQHKTNENSPQRRPEKGPNKNESESRRPNQPQLGLDIDYNLNAAAMVTETYQTRQDSRDNYDQELSRKLSSLSAEYDRGLQISQSIPVVNIRPTSVPAEPDIDFYDVMTGRLQQQPESTNYWQPLDSPMYGGQQQQPMHGLLPPTDNTASAVQLRQSVSSADFQPSLSTTDLEQVLVVLPELYTDAGYGQPSQSAFDAGALDQRQLENDPNKVVNPIYSPPHYVLGELTEPTDGLAATGSATTGAEQQLTVKDIATLMRSALSTVGKASIMASHLSTLLDRMKSNRPDAEVVGDDEGVQMNALGRYGATSQPTTREDQTLGRAAPDRDNTARNTAYQHLMARVRKLANQLDNGNIQDDVVRRLLRVDSSANRPGSRDIKHPNDMPRLKPSTRSSQSITANKKHATRLPLWSSD